MIAALVLAAAAALPLQGETGSVWGQVRSSSSGAPLAFATVEVVMNGIEPVRVSADENGNYFLRDLPPGRRVIRASHIDHARREVEVIVVAGRRMGLDFDLELRPLRLPTMTAQVGGVEAALRDTMAVKASELGTAAVRAMEATPGVAELGLAEAAREVPGHEPLDPSDVLFVRGAAADLKLVMLNGAPVFAPFHVGGLINALDTDLYRSATLYLGGASARYDGGLSYVMDLETRSGRSERVHTTVSVDMLAARGIVEGPLFKGASFVASGRAVHGIGTEALVNQAFPYSYGDGTGRLDVDLGDGRILSLTGFWNRETVSLDSLAGPGQLAEWGNHAGSARLRAEIGSAEALFTVAAGRFAAQLPVGGLRVLLTRGESRHARATADFSRAIGESRLQWGVSLDKVDYGQQVWPEAYGRDSTLFASSTEGDVAAAYVDAAANPIDRVQIRVGLRANRFSLDPTIRWAPRLSATVLLTDRVALTVAGGKYHQYVRSTGEPLAVISTPAIAATGEIQSLDVASASHLLVALDQDLGEGIRLSLEGFYKSFTGLPSTAGDKAEASGVDLWVRRNKGVLTGWFGYSLAWVWSDDDPARSSPHLFAGRQLMTAGVSGPTIGKGTFDVRVAYGAGLPFAAIPEPEAGVPVGVSFVDAPAFSIAEPVPSVPDAPDQPYLRVDAQLARTWEAEWRGIAFSLTPYVKVLNALNRRDGIFYYYDRGTDSKARALAGLPVLPIIGLDWKF